MILVCPQCATRYIVPDSAIGVTGRQVRCAACRHSWYQEGVLVERPEPVLAVAEPVSDGTIGLAGAHVQPVASAPDVVAPSFSAESTPLPQTAFASAADAAMREPDVAVVEPDPVPAVTEVPYVEPEFPAYGDEGLPQGKPRRNPAKAWTLAAFLFLLAVSGAGAALWYFGPPDWAVNLGLAPASARSGLIIDIPKDPDRRRLSSGGEIFSFNAEIQNRSNEELSVPPVVVELRDDQRRLVFSWMTKADKARLKPGEKARISESRLDIPKNARNLELNFVDSGR